MYYYMNTEFQVICSKIESKRRERVNPLNRGTLQQAPCQVLQKCNGIQINTGMGLCRAYIKSSTEVVVDYLALAFSQESVPGRCWFRDCCLVRCWRQRRRRKFFPICRPAFNWVWSLITVRTATSRLKTRSFVLACLLFCSFISHIPFLHVIPGLRHT